MTTATKSLKFDKFPIKLSKTFKQYVENHLKMKSLNLCFGNF